jgi:electron transfer flavoprotein alpha subunit
MHLPAIVSCAERLIDPSKVDPPGRAAVPADRIRTMSAADLGAGPWGQAASPTWVGPVKVMAVSRARTRWLDAPIVEQVMNAVHVLRERGALDGVMAEAMRGVPAPRKDQPRVVVLAEPHRTHMTRELLGAAAQLTGNVLAVTVGTSAEFDAPQMVAWGADDVVQLDGENIEEDVARAVTRLAREEVPWAILSPSTAWGREIASRVAAALDAGLTGDAVELEIDEGRLVAWKPAFGGQLVAAIGCTSTPQLATVRAGVLPHLTAREMPVATAVTKIAMTPHGRIRVLARTRDDDIDVLADANAVIGIGTGVAPDEYGALEPLRTTLMAELGATRKVTDKGWLPRARQIGITGRAIAPRLFVSIGASGKFNHMVGVRAAGTVLAINPDPTAPVWDASDVGIVGDWREVVPMLDAALRD